VTDNEQTNGHKVEVLIAGWVVKTQQKNHIPLPRPRYIYA